LIAAVCHDLGHDGNTNSYHTNAITQRSIDSNDVSVQESFHAAELFRILSQEKYNFLKDLSKDEFKIFRKRVIGLILGTDMAKHMEEVSRLKSLLTQHSIENGKNMEKLVEIED
jgi:ethanolamine utilization protein EutP (predicted NTPase)